MGIRYKSAASIPTACAVLLIALFCSHTCESFVRGSPSGRRDSSLSALPDLDLRSFLEAASTAPIVAGGLAVSAVAAAIASRPPARLITASGLRNLVEGTYLHKNGDELACVYKASRDGWSARDFHEKVDNKGSAVVALKHLGSAGVIGGYNPNGWRSSDDYYLSNQAFLWTLPSPNARIVKLPIVASNGGNTPALFDYATGGPCFGTSDLHVGPPQAAVMGGFAGPDMEDISVNEGNLRRGKSSVVNFEWARQWPVNGQFRIVEVEVYARM
jgi:hypothetical protein